MTHAAHSDSFELPFTSFKECPFYSLIHSLLFNVSASHISFHLMTKAHTHTHRHTLRHTHGTPIHSYIVLID